MNCQIAVNHAVELTAEEKEEAIQKAQNQAYTKMMQPRKKG